MAAIREAWKAASRRQKGAIVGALIVSLLALSSLAGGRTSAPDSTTGAADLTASPTVAFAPTPTPFLIVTPEPTLEATPEPTAEGTPEPTSQPTAESASTAEPVLALMFTKFTSAVSRGANATAAVKTGGAAQCSITVEYKSGPSTAAGLEDKAAASNGVVSWTWTVGSRTTPGSWPVTVSCTIGDLFNTITRNLTVR